MADQPHGHRIVFLAPNPSIDRLLEVAAIEPGAIHRPDRVVAVPGGKGLNAARAAAALGGSVLPIAMLGGHAGDWIAEQLAAAGIAVGRVDVTGETRTCVSVLDRSTGRLTEFYEAGAPIDPGAFDEFEGAFRAALDDGPVAAVAMSGSLPPGSPVDGYARLVGRARERGVMTIIDTHGDWLRNALAAGPSVVKVNADEAGEVLGETLEHTSDVAEAAASLRRAGAGSVVITRGRDGAVARDDVGCWELTASLGSGPYPVGSGDAFLGGLAVAIVRGEPLRDAARLGMAAGIANADVPGAGILEPLAIARVVPLIAVTAI